MMRQPLGARLRGLFRRRSWSRFSATAVLCPVPAGYSSSSSPCASCVVE